MNTELKCIQCERRLTAADVNLDRMVGRCLWCDKVFDLSPQLGSSGGSTVSPPPRAKPKIPQPKSVTVTPRGTQELRLTRKWMGPQAIFLLFFATFWNGFLVVWYAAALSAPSIEVMALVFPLLHVAVGIGVGYTALAELLNSTEILVDSHRIKMTHGPLPWGKVPEVRVSDLAQLFVVQHIGSKGGRTYELCALTRDNVSLSLLKNISDAHIPRFIEQTIEEFLKITDAPVEGEHRN